MASYGRDWLRHPHAARLAIVVGSRNVNGLKMFDPRMAWQLTSSIFTVCGTVGGAFILSCKTRLLFSPNYLPLMSRLDYTPTVGLGCRSGGYLVYMVIALGLITIEIVVWWLTHETTHTADDLLARLGTRLERHISRGGMPEKLERVGGRTQRLLSWFRTTTFRDVVRRFVIRPGEMINTGWLTYIIFAQTFGNHIRYPTLHNRLTFIGSYQSCDCMSSNWANGGGFIDFQTYDYYFAHGVFVYWGSANALSMFVMSVGLAYIVYEYCTQSHFSSKCLVVSPDTNDGLTYT